MPPSGQIRSRRRGTNSTGFQHDLYTIAGATDDTKQNVERLFMGMVDKTAADARDMLIQGQIPIGPYRAAWVRFLLSLGIRMPVEIESFKRRVRGIWLSHDPEFQAKYEAAKRDDWPDQMTDYLLQNDPTIMDRSAMMLATRMIQNESVTKLMMGATWRVLNTSSVSRRLLTSDHPVVMTNGLMRPDGHFALPISPIHLFIGFMRGDFADQLCNMPVGKLVRLTNDAVIGQARKNVYGVDRSQLAEVRKRMSKRDYLALFPEINEESDR